MGESAPGFQLAGLTHRSASQNAGFTFAPANRQGASIASGDVVVLDTANANSVKLTTTEGDRSVIGVVAQQNDGNNNPIDITIVNLAAGRVQYDGHSAKVKVNGAVAIGDYLITSTTAGEAKSVGASMRTGVFAKALSSFAGPGSGTVEALLIPQAADPSDTKGLIAFFAGACPAGWSEYAAADGRFILAITGAKTVGATKGAALADNALVPVPSHSHGIQVRDGALGAVGIVTGLSNGTQRSAGSDSAGLDFPYIQLRVCQKD